MPETKKRTASSTRSARSNGSTAAKRASSSARTSANSRAQASKRPAKTAEQGTNGGGQGAGNSGPSVLKSGVLPAVSAAAAAAAGVVGGIVLERSRGGSRRKVLGIPVPGTRPDMGTLVKAVAKTGKEFGKLAREVKTTRQKAEKAAKAL